MIELYRAGLSNSEIMDVRGCHPISHSQMKVRLRALNVLSVGVNAAKPAKALVTPNDYTAKGDDALALFLNWKLTDIGKTITAIARTNANAWLKHQRNLANYANAPYVNGKKENPRPELIWEGLPVLADALQDLDFEEENAVLTLLRAPIPAFPTEELLNQLSPRTLYPYEMRPPVPYTDPTYQTLGHEASITHSAQFNMRSNMLVAQRTHEWRVYRVVSRLAGRLTTPANTRVRRQLSQCA